MSASSPPPKRFGCCSGCLLVVVLLAGAIYLAYTYRNVIFSAAVKTMRDGSAAQLERLEREGHVPAEHRGLYEEFKQHLNDPKLGLLGILAVQESVHDALADSKLDESEVQLLEFALAFMKEHPEPTFGQYYRFGRAYDAMIQQIVEERSAEAVEKARAMRGHTPIRRPPAILDTPAQP